MAVTAYIGNPGSGKSFTVIKQCVEWVKLGRLIVSNIPLTDEGRALFGDLYIEYPKKEPPPCGWAHLWETYPGAILVVDEAWRHWPAGQKTDAMPEAERSLFAEHRHYTREGVSSDIVLLTQSLADIAAFPRGKIDSTFNITVLSALGQLNRYRMDVYSGAYTGRQTAGIVKVREIFGRHTADVWKLYQSNTCSEQAGKVQMTDKRVSIFSSRFILFGVPIGILCALFFGWYGVHRHLNMNDYYGQKPKADSDGTVKQGNEVKPNENKVRDYPVQVAGQVGDYVILADGRIGLKQAWGCLSVLGVPPTTLPICSHLPLSSQIVSKPVVNEFLPTYANR